VGDPHVTSLRIARRIDRYSDSVLDKLRQCAQLCARHHWRMVILGDLFDRARESDMGLLSDLIGILRSCPHVPLVLVGNHDKSGLTLTSDTTLAMMGRAGVVEIIDAPRMIEAAGVALYGVPHAADLPSGLSHAFLPVVVISHHDLKIEPNHNPRAQPIGEIAGCDLVVNGHDHTTKQPVRCGQTMYLNTGNISRVSVAQLHHQPAVFALFASEHTPVASDESGLFEPQAHDDIVWRDGWVLRRFDLVCEPGERVFDLTGYEDVDRTDEALAAYLSSFEQVSQERFVQALASTSALQAAGGGDTVVRIIREVMDDMQVKPAVRRIVEACLHKGSDDVVIGSDADSIA
jgi:sulfur relay (sulfurtransferase) DsrC/TusE family protein